MPTEIEAKFLNVDHAAMRQRLQARGYTCVQPQYLMRRVVFDIPGQDYNSWARVRDEAGKTTVSFKRTNDGNSITGTTEVQITADDFDAAVTLLEAIGMLKKGYQETRREEWSKGSIEVTLDEWPCLAPFIEIEGPDEAAVKAVAAELGFDWNDAMFGAAGAVYEKMGISAAAIHEYPRLTFENAAEIMKLAKKRA